MLKPFYTILFFFFIIFSADAQVMVKDIKQGGGGSFPYNLRQAGKYVYFKADDGIHGLELWRTDGTDTGTQMVIDINPGPADGLSHFFTYHDNDTQFVGQPVEVTDSAVYFVAKEPVHGIGLWKSTGTAASTHFVHELSQELFGSYLLPFRDQLLFSYQKTPESTDQLWITDGTDSGTRPVVNINSDTIAQWYTPLIYGHKFYFIIGPVTDTIYRSDGTSIGTEFYTLNDSVFVDSDFGLHPWQGSVYFSTRPINRYNPQTKLYKLDTVTNAIALVKTFNDSAIALRDFMSFDSIFLFNAVNTLTNNTNTWRSNGNDTGTYIISDQNVILEGGIIYHNLYFNLYINSYYRLDLFSTARNTDGTIADKNLFNLPGSYIAGYPISGTVFNDKLIFNFTDDAHGQELWATDGTFSGTGLISDICPGACYSNPGNYIILNNQLLFTCNDGVHGNELWKLDSNFSVQPLAIHQLEPPHINIFPNPTNQYLQIQTDNPADIDQVIIFNLAGQQVISQTQPIQNRISVTSLSAGMYFLQLSDKNGGQVGTAKFIKE